MTAFSRIFRAAVLVMITGLASLPAQAETSPSAGMSLNYVLRPFDVIQFSVFQEPDLEKRLRLGADGSISIPLIGKQKVGGLTVEAAQQFLTDLYDRDYLVNPQLSILVLEYSDRKVQVLGQVNSQGPIVIPIDRELSLVDAISHAGGPTRLANLRRITLKRRESKSGTITFTLDAQDMMTNADAERFILQDGDTIFIPERTF